MPDALNKIVNYILKAIATVLVSSTGYQLFDGKWFGQAIFSSYLIQQDVTILTPPAWDDLYSALGSDSLTHSISNISAFSLLLSLALMLALLAHVRWNLFCLPADRERRDAAKQRDRAVGDRSREDRATWGDQLRVYRRVKEIN